MNVRVTAETVILPDFSSETESNKSRKHRHLTDEEDHDEEAGGGGARAEDVDDEVERDEEAERDRPDVVDDAHALPHAVGVRAHHVRDLPLAVACLGAGAQLGDLVEEQADQALAQAQHALDRHHVVVRVGQEVHERGHGDGDGQQPGVLRRDLGLGRALDHEQDLLHE